MREFEEKMGEVERAEYGKRLEELRKMFLEMGINGGTGEGMRRGRMGGVGRRGIGRR